MSSITANERADALAADVEKELNRGDLSHAARLAREAASLAPNNPRVQEALDLIQQSTSKTPLVQLITSYLHNGDERAGKGALQQLKDQTALAKLPPQDAGSCATLLLDYPNKPPLDLLDEMTGALFSASLAARKQLASHISSSSTATEIFQLLFQRGSLSFQAWSSVLTDSDSWLSSESQAAGQVGAFQLLIGKMMEAAHCHADLCLNTIIRLLAAPSASQTLKTLLHDPDVFDIILAGLDVRNSLSTRSQATLATAKLLELTGEEGQGMVRTFVAGKVARQHNEDLIVAFSAAAAIFPLERQMAAQLFLTEGFVEELVRFLQRNSQEVGHRKSHRLEQAALELLSAACIDKACRESVSKHCTSWLRDVAETSDEAERASMAALVLAKTSQIPDASVVSEAETNDISSLLSNMALNATNEADRQSSLEGLAYTSLQPKIKEDIASNTKLLSTLVDTLKSKTASHPAIFGALNIFANLTAFRPTQSEEQKRMADLKAYANSSKPSSDNPLDDDTHVAARCKKVLNAGVVPVFLPLSKTGSTAVLTLIIQILNSLARDKTSRGHLAQQGAIKLLLSIIQRLSASDAKHAEKSSTTVSPPTTSPELSTALNTASHALARVLISVNPHHIFTPTLPALSAIRPLHALLLPQEDDTTRDLLPTFESLLALTNLASMSDPAVAGAIIRTSFPVLEDLLLSHNTLVQRAAAELVCNLMAAPQGVAKFADGSGDAKRRLHVLLALADARDGATRRAAGGALAMLTEWDRAVEAVVDRDGGVRALLGMVGDEDEGVVQRGLVCVGNVVEAPGEVGRRGVEVVKREGGVEVLKGALVKGWGRDVLATGVEVLKKLV